MTQVVDPGLHIHCWVQLCYFFQLSFLSYCTRLIVKRSSVFFSGLGIFTAQEEDPWVFQLTAGCSSACFFPVLQHSQQKRWPLGLPTHFGPHLISFFSLLDLEYLRYIGTSGGPPGLPTHHGAEHRPFFSSDFSSVWVRKPLLAGTLHL